MSIYRKSCRLSERISMKKLFAQGVPVSVISDKLRVQPAIITEVLEGKWDSKEKAMALAAMDKNKELALGKIDAEANKIAQIAAAAAAAINGQSPVLDQAALRAQIEAEIRAEMAEEKPKRKRRTPAEMAAAREADNEEEQAQTTAA